MVEGRTPVLTPAELFSEGLVEDPYPTYRRFLDAGPAHYVNYKRGTWAIFSHAGCSTAIRDVRLTAKRMGVFLLTITPEHRTEFAELMRLFGLWMLFIDAPEHTRLRKPRMRAVDFGDRVYSNTDVYAPGDKSILTTHHA